MPIMDDYIPERPKGSEPDVTSRFGIEAENTRLKDELRLVRTKLSRLKAEVRRLNTKVGDLLTVRANGISIGYGAAKQEESFRRKYPNAPPCDISNNPMDTGD